MFVTIKKQEGRKTHLHSILYGILIFLVNDFNPMLKSAFYSKDEVLDSMSDTVR